MFFVYIICAALLTVLLVAVIAWFHQAADEKNRGDHSKYVIVEGGEFPDYIMKSMNRYRRIRLVPGPRNFITVGDIWYTLNYFIVNHGPYAAQQPFIDECNTTIVELQQALREEGKHTDIETVGAKSESIYRKLCALLDKEYPQFSDMNVVRQWA